MTEPLGRFGHHPDPAIDFVVEVEAIEGELADISAGLSSTMDVDARIGAALTFRVGGDARAIAGKNALRAIRAARRRAMAEPPEWCKAAITLTARQLRNALDFVAPDFDKDEEQRESELVIAQAPEGAITDDDGKPEAAGLVAWLSEYPEEGCIPLLDEYEAIAAPAAAESVAMHPDHIRAERRACMFGDVIENYTYAMQAAVIERYAGGGAEVAMDWIQNTLAGPGHMPDLDIAAALPAAKEAGAAQAWFDIKTAEHEAFRAAHPMPAAPGAASPIAQAIPAVNVPAAEPVAKLRNALHEVTRLLRAVVGAAVFSADQANAVAKAIRDADKALATSAPAAPADPAVTVRVRLDPASGEYLAVDAPAVPATDAPSEPKVDVHALLRQADEQQQARAEQLPTEEDCIRLMVQCRLRLEELGWRSIDYAPKENGKSIDAIVPGWPRVKSCHWLGASWFADEAGDLWPVKPAWFKARAALTQAASTGGKS